MSDIIMPGSGLQERVFEPCPDKWASLHVFYNKETGQAFPARCKRWSCFPCAQLNYYNVDRLISLGEPQRFITLTRAGNTPKEISLNLKHLIQGIRRKGKTFEYVAVPELHRNGQAHLHLMQRGDFVAQSELSEMWEKYTSKSYNGQGSFVVDIRFIHDKQNVKGYLLKYMRKSWLSDGLDAKSWASLIAKYPGMNHYRASRNWLSERPEKASGWELIPKAALDTVRADTGPNLDSWFEDFYPAFSPVKALALSGRSKPSRVAKQLAKPLTALVVVDNQIRVGCATKGPTNP